MGRTSFIYLTKIKNLVLFLLVSLQKNYKIMKEINLKEILAGNFPNSKELYEFFEKPVYVDLILHSMKEACKQTLELVAEKVSDSKLDLNYYNQNEQMQRKIRNTINQIK